MALRPGCPIRKSQDQGSVTSSPGLIAGSYVLHRLSTPRHPSSALDDLVMPTDRRTDGSLPRPSGHQWRTCQTGAGVPLDPAGTIHPSAPFPMEGSGSGLLSSRFNSRFRFACENSHASRNATLFDSSRDLSRNRPGGPGLSTRLHPRRAEHRIDSSHAVNASGRGRADFFGAAWVRPGSVDVTSETAVTSPCLSNKMTSLGGEWTSGVSSGSPSGPALADAA